MLVLITKLTINAAKELYLFECLDSNIAAK